MKRLMTLLLILLLTVAASAAAGDPLGVNVRDNDSEYWDKPISIDLKDAEIRQVIQLTFDVAELDVQIADCVEGTVTLKFENVGLIDALESIARVGKLRVRPLRDGYQVDCGEPDPSAESRDKGQLLEFTLTDLTDNSVITQPSLLVLYNSLAEIQVGSVVTEDLDPAGDFFPGDFQPNIRLKTYLDEDPNDPQGGQLRGIFEIAERENGSAATMRMVVHSFEVDLPVHSRDVRVIEVGLGDKRFELTVSRPSR